MKIWQGIGLFIMGVGVGILGGQAWEAGGGKMLSPSLVITDKVIEPVYRQYSFPNLVERRDVPSQILTEDEIFYFQTEGKRMSGAINIPEGLMPRSGYPVVVMLRGYVDREIYETGVGTRNAAKYFASQGYLAVAPDFLGYGESEPEDLNALGARVVKPVAVLDLLASLASLEEADLKRVYLWGHSNGGQIALSVLEILGERENRGKNLPYKLRAASLWAPVSKPFPYSILYYTDEAEDRGKSMRAAIAEWEEEYDAFEYSIDSYWNWIRTPVQVHQGTVDDAVPLEWSDELVENLSESEGLEEKQVRYYAYPGADHNLRPVWDSVVARDVNWFGSN